MRRDKLHTRQNIVEAAHQLFYRQGYARASVDAIAARAKITKRTLYSHFRSKDDLLAAVLARHSELQMTQIREIDQRMPTKLEAMIDSLFSQMAEWAGKPRYSGSGLTRVVMELADLPGHPARAIARGSKATTENWLAQRLARNAVPEAKKRAREVMLLIEGAAALMLIHGDHTYANAAARAAKRLVDHSN